MTLLTIRKKQISDMESLAGHPPLQQCKYSAKTSKSLCPGISAHKTNKAIKQALSDQLMMLEKKKSELSAWDDDAKKHFKKWFGKTDDVSRKTMEDRIDKMITMNKTIQLTNFQSAEPPDDADPDLYAYVYADKPPTIYLGQMFCKAPPTGMDSKAGTLCHEMSHFKTIGGTKDYVYGAKNAEQLAKKKPKKAMKSADNFQYYCEGI